MKPPPFEHHAPKSVAEAVELLSRVAPLDGRVLAGGQSLVPMMNFRLATPKHLVDINNIPELAQLKVGDDGVTIGACVRHVQIERMQPGSSLAPILGFIARHIAHYPIRTRGTFCGSIANADPASEWCLVAVALGASIVSRSVNGTREILADAFFLDLMTTALEENELVVEVRLPASAINARHGFYEISRRSGDFAQCAAFVCYVLEDGKITNPRVCVGGVERRPRRLPDAEQLLNGQRPCLAQFELAATSAAREVTPLDASSDSYKRDLARAAVVRALVSTEDAHV